MASIVRLAEYRKRRAASRHAAPQVAPHIAHKAASESRYYCTRCDADEFRMSAAGLVHCAHCGAWMRNLLVGATQKT